MFQGNESPREQKMVAPEKITSPNAGIKNTYELVTTSARTPLLKFTPNIERTRKDS